ncbi:MAG: hypothetical protein GY754_16175 [bacterium]|nr:hypothetical protein [bacterium]
MNAILDYIFLNAWILVIGVFITIPAGIVLGKRTWLRNKIKDRILRGAFFALPALFAVPGILNPIYLGYGYARDFRKASLSGKYLCLLDFHYFGGHDDDFVERVRLHVIDPETGLRKNRIILGSGAQLLDHQNNLYLYKLDHKFILMDLQKGDSTTRWSNETLPGQFLELSVGIEKARHNTHDRVIDIQAKNGKHYVLKPFENKLLPYGSLNRENIPHAHIRPSLVGTLNFTAYKLSNDAVEKKVSNRYSKTILRLTGSSNGIKQLSDANRRVIPKGDNFLQGMFLEISEELQRAIMVSFKTTDRNFFYLTCVDFNGTILWQINQEQFPSTGDPIEPKRGSLAFAVIHGNTVIFNSGGNVYCVKIKNGRLLWKTRL